MSLELPPAAFSNAMNDIQPNSNFRNWRRSKAWKIFVAGYNACVTEAAGEVALLRDLRTPKHLLYGEIQKSKTRPTRSKAVSKKSP